MPPILFAEVTSDATWAMVALVLAKMLRDEIAYWRNNQNRIEANRVQTEEFKKNLNDAKAEVVETVKPIAADIAEHRKECTPKATAEVVKQAVVDTLAANVTVVAEAVAKGFAAGAESERNKTPAGGTPALPKKGT